MFALCENLWLYGRPTMPAWVKRLFWIAVALMGIVSIVARPVGPNEKSAAILSRMAARPYARRRSGGAETDKRDKTDPAANVAASYSRFSSDMQDAVSCERQKNKCRDRAVEDKVGIPIEFEFSDEAVSGTKLHRAGLDALLEAAAQGKFRTVYFYSLSRLARESVITMPILKRLVFTYKIRVVSTTEGVDSDRDGWDLMATMLSIQHERYIKELAISVFDGQEMNVEKGFSNGDQCFGFTTEPVPGSDIGRRGRHPRPRMLYVIDPETSEWVKKIFHWYVRERRSLRWIARELNRLGAPKDHRSSTTAWRHSYVRRLLRNRKYIGFWPWGEKRNVRDPETGKITQEDRSAEECEKWVRHFAHLRLIDDETFEIAQQHLDANTAKYAECRNNEGQFSGSLPGAEHHEPGHLLSGLIFCPEGRLAWNTGGAGGKYLFCPEYHQGLCTCQTTLRRDRAERMILDEIGQHILADPVWHNAVREAAEAAWKAYQREVPSELAAAEASLADVERRIQKLLDAVEEGHADPDLRKRLAERRAQHAEIAARVQQYRERANHAPPKPTEEWIAEQLRNLGETLAGGGPAAAYALRELVGHRIVARQVVLPDRKRHFIQLEFTINCRSLTAAAGLATPPAEIADQGETITLDIVEPNPLDAQAEEAKRLYDEGLLGKEIAASMNCSPANITKLLKHWSMLHDQPLPDGRSRRSGLERKHLQPPKYQVIADEVMQRLECGELLQEISEAVGLDRATVTKAANFGRRQRGLAPMDGRTRRKQLDRKVSRPRKRSTQGNDEGRTKG